VSKIADITRYFVVISAIIG